jgi:ribosomal protein S18 acetylase RimI-like enzyme
MITYNDRPNEISADQLQGFFVNWPNPPSPARHRELLVSSDEVVLAIDDATSQVVGFINAITDHVLSAYIPLLEVLPAYQGQGIGTELLRRMLAKLEHLYMVDLLCDPDLQPFYARLGMHQTTGMLIRRHDRQSGA